MHYIFTIFNVFIFFFFFYHTNFDHLEFIFLLLNVAVSLYRRFTTCDTQQHSKNNVLFFDYFGKTSSIYDSVFIYIYKPFGMEITCELILLTIKQPKTIKNKSPSLKSNYVLLLFTYMVLSTRFTYIYFIC